MRIKIKFNPTAKLIEDSIRLAHDNLSNVQGHGEFKRDPFIRNFFLNASEYAQLEALAEVNGVSPQKLIRFLVCFRYDTLAFETNQKLYKSVADGVDKGSAAMISRPFKPKASLLADAIRLSVQNLSSKKGKGEYRRLPLLKNIHMNCSEATMLRQLADDAGVGMQPYLRSLINWAYEMAVIDADIDLYEYVTTNINMPNRGDSCYAYATNTIYEGFKEAANPTFAEEITQVAKSEEFGNELEDAIDAMCFPEKQSDDLKKIQKTLEALLTSMKKSDELVKARSIVLELYQNTLGLSENLPKLCEEVQEIMRVSLLSGEYDHVVLDELNKASVDANMQTIKMADGVIELDAIWPDMSNEERLEILGNSFTVAAKTWMLESLKILEDFENDIESTFQDIVGSIIKDDEYLVMCSNYVKDIREFILIIKRLMFGLK